MKKWSEKARAKPSGQNRPVLIVESEARHNSGAPRRLAESFLKLDYLVFYIRIAGSWNSTRCAKKIPQASLN